MYGKRMEYCMIIIIIISHAYLHIFASSRLMQQDSVTCLYWEGRKRNIYIE